MLAGRQRKVLTTIMGAVNEPKRLLVKQPVDVEVLDDEGLTVAVETLYPGDVVDVVVFETGDASVGIFGDLLVVERSGVQMQVLDTESPLFDCYDFDGVDETVDEGIFERVE